jgi:LPS-assembly protein
VIFSVLSLLLGVHMTQAQVRPGDGLRMSADSISRDTETKVITLEGKVEISFDNQVIKADKAVINQKSEEILAEGHVILATEDTIVEGQMISFNYKTKLGRIENGFVQSGTVVFEGRKIEKKGENSYLAQDAKFTSCTTCPASWSFSGQEIDAEVGGYAYIKYPVLRVADFPIFILPRILIPLKSDRQSGLLVPSLDFSRKGGAALTMNYYWAVSRSKDVTLSLKNYQRRGLKALGEYRYVLSEGSTGVMHGATIRDQAFSLDGQPNSPEFEIPRGYVNYRHYFTLPNDVINRMRFTYVTDLRYPRDFSEEVAGHGDPALENSFSLTQNTSDQHRSVDMGHYVNLLKDENPMTAPGDAYGRNDDAVHRWPEINWHFVDRSVLDSSFFVGLKVNYTHFARGDFGYDDIRTRPGGSVPESDPGRSAFDSRSDLIRTGHRTIIEPTISYPFQVGDLINITPRVKYNDAIYRFTPVDTAPPAGPGQAEYTQNAYRRFLQTDIGATSVFSRVYNLNGETKLKHEVIPEVLYSEVPWFEQSNHPFFGDFPTQPYSRIYEAVSTADFRGSSRLQFDYRDRLFDKRLIGLGLTNHWVKKTSQTQGKPIYEKVATLAIRQSFDFNEAERDKVAQRNFPWSPLNILLDLRTDRLETFTVADVFPYADVVNYSSRVRFKTLYGNYLELNYADRVFVDKDNNVSNETKNLGAGVGLRTSYLDLTGLANYSLITKIVESWEYIALFKPPGDCWTIKAGHRKTVGADDIFQFSFNFEFGGV